MIGIDRAQELYDRQLPEDAVISSEIHEEEISKLQSKVDDLQDDLDNAVERGDKYFDLYDLECKRANQLQEAYDSLTDRLRERDDEILRLTKLIIDNGIGVECE